MTVCPECGEEKGTHVYDHLFSVHNYSRDDIEVLKMKKRKLKSAASVSGFECNHCGSMHLSRGALATHKSKQHRRKDESAEGSAVSTNTVHKERVSASLLANIFCSSDGTLHEPLRILWSRLRAVGCIIDAAQVKPTRRKLKCSVDRCVYKGGPIDSIQLKCTLPSNVELAMQWICVCVSDPFHQNTHILRLLDLLKADIDDTAPLPQTISPKKLVAFPFRDVIMKLRSRSVALSEAGYDDVEVDKLAPNCVLVSPSTGPLNCDVPG
ncbi:unnamed protein product [Heligmosomoides polygyrus]|uniref:C2H2-type domain-containing protein n=1 Tax=Heligmosomoides polygyrus TaxID=6339 RepID=A0A183FX93_HELPZ|nr:unnamed protein product [Heligmosomoides polygyrus]